MKITIHRGTDQIGGCVTEIECGGYRVFVDFGEVLPGADESVNHELGLVEGLSCGDVSRSALFVSHYHGDHIGKIGEVVDGVSVYVGKTALEVFRCVERRLSHIPDAVEADRHKRLLKRSASFRTFEALQSIRVGDMVVTPLLVDHSAFDAYMFIIEGDNVRVLHTGDFRAHGFRGKRLLEMLGKYAGRIDYLILEGTTLLRPDAVMKTERQLQVAFERQFRRNAFNFVLVSSTNFDRIFSLYHAARRAGRCFVCDDYQAEMLRIVSGNHKQYSSFYDIDFDGVLVLKRFGRKPLAFKGGLKPYLEQHGFCMLVRATDAFEPLLRAYADSPGFACYYSQWDGYLDRGKLAFNEALHAFLQPYPIKHLHTSGHADVQTLRAVCETVKPTRGIIPIHTDAPEAYEKWFGDVARVVLLRDGEQYTCLKYV